MVVSIGLMTDAFSNPAFVHSLTSTSPTASGVLT
jgi:hypothetical protein